MVTKKSVVDALSEGMKQRGFSAQKKNDRFFKRVNFGCLYYQFAFLSKAGWLFVVPAACIRFDQVESIYHRTSGTPPEMQADTFTIGIDFDRHFNDQTLRFVAKEAADLTHLVPSLLWAFDTYAEPFYSEFGSIIAADTALNDRPSEPCPYRPMPWLRAASGLIIAKLAGRENFQALANIYQEQVASFSNGFYKGRFNHLLDILSLLSG